MINNKSCISNINNIIYLLLYNRYYKSTIGNIKLICEFRKKRGTINAEENYFRCWMEYFINATKQEIDSDIHSFPVCI